MSLLLMVPPMLAVSVSTAGRGGGIDGDLLRRSCQRELHGKRVGLLGDELEVAENLLLKPGAIDGQGEGVRRQRIEIEDTGIVAGAGDRFVRGIVLKRQGGAWNDCAGGIGDDALNRSAKLCVGKARRKHHGEENQDRERGITKPPDRRSSM